MSNFNNSNNKQPLLTEVHVVSQSVRSNPLKRITSFLDIDLLKYLGQRIVLMLITLVIIVTVAFVVLRLMPNQPNMDPGLPEYQRKLLEETWGYDKPILEQYRLWLKNVFPHNDDIVCLEYDITNAEVTDLCYGAEEGDVVGQEFVWTDWGKSHKGNYRGHDVVDMFQTKILKSMELNIYALVISIPFGIGFGILAALKKNTLIDYVISLGVIMLISIPSFVVAFAAQHFIAYEWDILPPHVDYETGSYLVKMASMIMPVMALASGAIAGMTRVTRAELTEVLTSDFMQLATTKGLTTRQSTTRHALRNAMVPLVGMLLGMFVGLISGSLIIERIFNVDGVGDVLFTATVASDYNVSMAGIVFYTVIGLSASIMVDVAYGIVDPRIRVGGTK